MLSLTCHCASVRIDVARRPDFINECNCTLCSKTGARWGYFSPSDLSVKGTTIGYRRNDKDDPSAEVHFCPQCGSTTHFVLTKSAVAKFGDAVAGANMWLADAQELAGIELRYPDGRGWSGNGDFTYVRDAHVLG